MRQLEAKCDDPSNIDDDFEAIELPKLEVNKSAFFKMLHRCKEIDLKNVNVNNFPSSSKLPENCAIKVVSLDSCSINCKSNGAKPSITHFTSYNNTGRIRAEDWFDTSLMEVCSVTSQRDIAKKRRVDQVNQIRETILKTVQ